MEKVLCFLDYANINSVAKTRGVKIDYSKLLNYLGEGRFLVDSFAYIPIDPRKVGDMNKKIERLWLDGFVVISKIGTPIPDGYRCDFDVEISMDMMKVAYQNRPDIVVLLSGDSDFIPVIIELRKLGIRVEVASFESNTAREMILKCSGFVNLELVPNIFINNTQNSKINLQHIDIKNSDILFEEKLIINKKKEQNIEEKEDDFKSINDNEDDGFDYDDESSPWKDLDDSFDEEED
ncbi:NYN domain-containing protein [bacterium]|nr:NYN domain-containing protein [bacterium]